MGTFIAKRLLLAIPMLLGASLLIFAIFYASRVDPVRRALGERAQDEAIVQQLRDEYGLNDPPWMQYGRFIGGVVRGDFGRSIRTQRSVTAEIRQRFPATLELGASAFLISLVFGLGAGIIAGTNRERWPDYLAMGAAILAVSLPVFWLALLLSHGLAVERSWFPLDARLDLMLEGQVPARTGLFTVDALLAGRGDVLRNALWHLALPSFTLALVSSALVARMTRSSLLEVLNQDFVRTARAKGLGPVRCLWHVLRNALIPVVTILGLEIPALLGGAVIIETIFAWPGMGSYLIESILFADIPAVQGIVMFLTMIFILVNLGVDLVYGTIDPRARQAIIG